MSKENEALPQLLLDCEARLERAKREIEETLAVVRQVSATMRDVPVGDTESRLGEVLHSHRDELVSLVLAALESAPRARQTSDEYMRSLIYRPDEKAYRVGRRQLGLTETERTILDTLWAAMPEAVSRETILKVLYPQGPAASNGAIDVFVSKLRQKLKLASGGRDFIQSIRGQGWALKTEYCRNRTASEPEALRTA